MLRSIGLALALGSASLLAGCGGGDTVAEALGMAKDAPDEFAVVKRRPLILPPDFTLRPPRPGEVTEDRTSSAQALAALSGGAAAGTAAAGTATAPASPTANPSLLATPAESPAEDAFLSELGRAEPGASTSAPAAPVPTGSAETSSVPRAGVTSGTVAEGDDLLARILAYEDTTSGATTRPAVVRRDQVPVGGGANL